MAENVASWVDTFFAKTPENCPSNKGRLCAFCCVFRRLAGFECVFLFLRPVGGSEGYRAPSTMTPFGSCAGQGSYFSYLNTLVSGPRVTLETSRG
jgi:hypothetical protein